MSIPFGKATFFRCEVWVLGRVHILEGLNSLKSMVFVDERVVTVIDYLPEHRETAELPLQTVRRTDSSGMRVPTVGFCALAAVLGESAQGDISEPTLCVVKEAERNNAGMATLNTPYEIQLLNCNSVLCHRQLPIQRMRKRLRKMERSLVSDVFGHTHVMKERNAINQTA